MNSIRSRGVFVVLIIAALVVISAVYPFKSTVVPAWRIRVVDEDGNPYVEHRVEQAWKHYSLELEAGSNGEVRWTDQNGYVSFPERTLRANLLWRIAIPLFSSVMTLAHGSTGVSATVFTTGPQGYKSAEYVSGKPPPEQLVLIRQTEE